MQKLNTYDFGGKSMGTKKMIVMTESSKFKNNCVAGIDVNTGDWVRIVSDDENIHGALTNEDITYEDGTMCQVMDVVSVPYISNVPTASQPENILIDRKYYIEKQGKATLGDVLAIHPDEMHNYLFGTRYSSVKEEYLEELGVNYSLTLIKGSNLTFRWKPNNHGLLKLKLTFSHNGIEYTDMSVTDPEFYGIEDGISLSDAYIVVSIGTPYNGACYKFVAKIFPI